MKITKRSFIGWICGLSLLLSSNVFSQGILEDTLLIPVTYYDFHSDGSNPEFEQKHLSGVKKGMVQTRLDKDGLPIPTANANDIRLNSYMKYWYRPFQDSARGDNTYPIYDYSTGLLTGIGTRDNDQSFVNLVIKDSLRFVRVPGTNMYRYDTTAFFPLDKYNSPTTFGIERNQGHNYAFTMHLEFKFTKTEDAQIFRFRGDDDVWAFIDSTLVMDLGGIHEPAEGSFTVSDSLVTCKEYSFDLFFAERHTTMSSIRIETNLFKWIQDYTIVLLENSASTRNFKTNLCFSEIAPVYSAGCITFSKPLPDGAIVSLFDIQGRLLYNDVSRSPKFNLPPAMSSKAMLWRVEYPGIKASGRLLTTRKFN